MSGEPHIEYFHMGQWPVFVGFTMSPKAFGREMRRLGVTDKVPFFARDNANASTHFFVDREGGSCILITMPKVGKTSHSQYAALVAHESLHVVQEMQRQLNRGAPFGDEADAYLLQSIVQNCLQLAFREGLEVNTRPRTAGDD